MTKDRPLTALVYVSRSTSTYTGTVTHAWSRAESGVPVATHAVAGEGKRILSVRDSELEVPGAMARCHKGPPSMPLPLAVTLSDDMPVAALSQACQ
jgi:hypothetical protein